MYVCNLCMYVCMYVCIVKRTFPWELVSFVPRCSYCDAQCPTEESFCIASFATRLQLGGLSQRGSKVTLWPWKLKDYLHGNLSDAVAQFPLAPPTHDQLCWSRAKEWPWIVPSHLQCMNELNVGAETLRRGLLATLYIYIILISLLTRRSLCTAKESMIKGSLGGRNFRVTDF